MSDRPHAAGALGLACDYCHSLTVEVPNPDYVSPEDRRQAALRVRQPFGGEAGSARGSGRETAGRRVGPFGADAPVG